MHFKKTLALALALCLMLALATGALAADGEQIRAANRLYDLGLFNGTGKNADGSPVFDLDAVPTREQAAVMLIRLLGEEDAALMGTESHPFRDVSPWADSYIAYAYAKGYTTGTGSTSYSGADAVTLQQYLTFVLRALGYADGKDFTYDNAIAFARNIGLYAGTYKNELSRGDMALISHSALSLEVDDGLTLLQSLVSRGAVSRTAVEGSGLVPGQGAKLSARQIYETYSSAVFCIEVYDEDGLSVGTGSGFFVDSKGTAVTSFHVLGGGCSAVATTSDGVRHTITGVYDYDVDLDLAVIKVEGSGFKALPLGDSDEIAVGETAYVISAPLGLAGTVSEGLISYIDRSVYGSEYLQFSAGIAQGSSGGPVINVYGQVIGIVCGTFSSGQNLNLALPVSFLSSLPDRNPVSVEQASKNAPLPSATLSVEPESLVIKVDDYAVVDVEYTASLGTFVSASFEEWGLASAAFLGNGITGSIDLMITALAPGETTIHIAVCDGDYQELITVDVPLKIVE